MAALGFRIVRWFVFGDGRSGIVYDDGGLPAGLDPHFFADLDAALEIARDTGIRLDLVLLDHRWMFEGVRETIADPATGALLEARLPHGRARVLQSTAGRTALFARVLEPLVRRYASGGARADLGEAVFATSLMNEPISSSRNGTRPQLACLPAARSRSWRRPSRASAASSTHIRGADDHRLRAFAQPVGVGRSALALDLRRCIRIRT